MAGHRSILRMPFVSAEARSWRVSPVGIHTLFFFLCSGCGGDDGVFQACEIRLWKFEILAGRAR